MDELTRRSFVRGSAGAAAVGAAGLGVFGVSGADAKTRAQHAHPVVAWLGDPRDGTITIMSGDHEVTIHDHALAAQIARHAERLPAGRHHRAPARKTHRKG